MYRIEIRTTRVWRDSTDEETEGINAHREDRRDCDGTQMRDRGAEDQTWPGLYPRLWCRHCEERVDIPR